MLEFKCSLVSAPCGASRSGSRATRAFVSLLAGLALVGVSANAQEPPKPPLFVAIDNQPIGLVHEFTGLPLTPDGWTDIDALIQSPGYADARIMYVSSSSGGTGQIYTQAQVSALGGMPTNPATAPNAYSTISAAMNQVRNGFPDVVLIKRGDSFTSGLGNLGAKSGRSKTERAIYSAYGDSGALPTFTGQIASGIGGASWPTNYIIVSHLDRYVPVRDPSQPGHNASAPTPDPTFRMLSGGRDMLFEGIRSRFAYGAVIQAFDGPFLDVALRRNVFVENYQPTGSSDQAQGAYFEGVNGLWIEGNLADRNGLSVSGEFTTIFNHNFYIQRNCSGVVAQRNIIARGNQNAMQGRPGGTYVNNLTLDSPIAPFSAGGGSVYSYNVQLGSANRPGGTHGVGVQDMSSGSVLAERNIVALKDSPEFATAYAFRITNADDAPTGSPPKSGIYRENVFYNWRGDGFWISQAGSWASWPGTASISLVGNKIVLPSAASGSSVVNVANWADALSASGNQYYHPTNATPFRRNGVNLTFEQWVAATGETGASFGPISFPDPSRDISSYMTSIGLSGGVLEFLSNARKLDRFNWDARFTADAVNGYIRAGFGVPDPE